MRAAMIAIPVSAFIVAAGAAAGASSLIASHFSTPPKGARDFYSRERYAAATQRVVGTLTPTAKRLLEASGDRGPTVVLVVRGGDITKCEDLGRQIRGLRRTIGSRSTLVVWGEQSHAPLVADFLRVERVGKVLVQPLDAAAVLQNEPALATPAVLVLGTRGELLAGVAHPLRFPNARFRSFAEELATPLQRVAQSRAAKQGGSSGDQ